MARGFLSEDQPGKSDLVDIKVRLKVDREKALLVQTTSAGEVWVPKSQAEFASDNDERDPKKGTLTLPKWLAESKGLV